MHFENLNWKFLERLYEIYSKEDIEIIKTGFSISKRNTTLRVNTIKTSQQEQENYFNSIWIKFEKIKNLDNAYKLLDLNWLRVAELKWFNSWEFYLQSLTSQIPVEFMSIKNDMTILDVASAPWWKASQICSKINNSWKIIANEISQIRREKLKTTIKKQWCKNVEITWIDARKLWEKFKKESFDFIIFDAPCSAEWRINLTNEKIWTNWSLENIEKNSKLQKEIINNIIPLLKKWWEFIYSTCTIAPEENEEIADFILKNFSDLEIQKIEFNYKYSKSWIQNFDWKKYNPKVQNCIRILPNEESEGFFVAKFKKN